MPAREFLSEQDEEKIVQAIAEAEEFTTGEIRIHIEAKCKKDPVERAKTIFGQLEMHETEARNGVILYIATKDRKVAIFGDEGISQQVENNFWQDEIDKLIGEFKQGNFEKGIESVVGDIGKKLKQFFPSDGADPNELDNEITFEDNRDDD
ncbi:TPM domain-containing protein [Rhodohalobacter sulfatireducens]|uniref:TPM domain-containing protein n=1 Tax=Rhodohalobacter sulfatireducens TaxID=2911366 RepID=A0ABS9KAR4_9BACT|nr:TPM domain-containing protein [Rhodohalobacter sulfatireducens]MCG2587918.1 TPM domain-containing protein [Rhodohalobacter sulfatireducens]